LVVLSRGGKDGVISDIICDTEILDALLELSDLFISRGCNKVNGAGIRWFYLTTKELDVIVVGFQCRALQWTGGR
jgi:hypothetical protein